jgi:transcriptional regulator with XRE-family HTH domain
MKNKKSCDRSWRLRPNQQEGYYIQYLLKQKGYSHAKIANCLGINLETVCNVIFGRRRSARIETEIARILDKPDWNDVVLEARSTITRKSVSTILAELIIKKTEQKALAMERLGAAMEADRASRTRRAG